MSVDYFRRLLSLPKEQELTEQKLNCCYLSLKPFQPVSRSTVARWIKSAIQEAGVGEQFSAHSIRGAVSTAAHMRGMSMSDVLNVADWTSDVFKTFIGLYTEHGQKSLLNAVIDV